MLKRRPFDFFQPVVIIPLVCLIYAIIIVVHFQHPLALVTLGSNYSTNPDDFIYTEEGYDGQFNFYIARNPSNAAESIDVPAYRFQRILLPALGGLLAFGQASWLPIVFLIINIAAVASGTTALVALLKEQGMSPWYSVGYGLSLAIMGSVRLSMAEPLAYGLALVGIWFAQRDRWMWSTVMFALAVLAKETTVLFVIGYALYLIWQRHWQRAILFTFMACLPFAIWQFVLFQHFGSFGIGSGGGGATSFELIPLMGLVRIYTQGGLGPFLVIFVLYFPFVILPTIWGIVVIGRRIRDWSANPPHVYWYLLLFNTLIMLFVPFSTYREPLGIFRFIAGLQIAVILYAAQTRNMRVLRYSTLWILTMLFIIMSDFGSG